MTKSEKRLNTSEFFRIGLFDAVTGEQAGVVPGYFPRDLADEIKAEWERVGKANLSIYLEPMDRNVFEDLLSSMTTLEFMADLQGFAMESEDWAETVGEERP